MRNKDFARKNYYKRSKKFNAKHKLRYVLLVIIMVVYAYRGPSTGYLVSLYNDASAKVTDFVSVQKPESWVFFDGSVDAVNFVHGKLGLRIMLQNSRDDCRAIAKKIFATKLPVVWVSRPQDKQGLCRFDIGPYTGMQSVFIARDRLFRFGFYGKIHIVNWVSSLRSFSV